MKLTILGVAVLSLIPQRALIEPPDISAVIVSTEWLANNISDSSVVVLEIVHQAPARDRLPGARYLDYMAITTDRGGNTTELPEIASLRTAFEAVGVSDSSHVVLYGDDVVMVARAFFSLDYLGHTNNSVLNGGMAKWKIENRPVTADVPRVSPGRITSSERPELLADAAWVMAHRRKPGVALIDTRTDGEYLGAGNRSGMPSDGHIAGARQLRWQQLTLDPDEGLFREPESLATLYADRVSPGDTVVTYCFVGFRASMSYMISRALGYTTKLYDGSYEDWARRKLPLVRGAKP